MKNHGRSFLGACFLTLGVLAGLGGCTISQIEMQGAGGKGLVSMPPTSMADFEHLVGKWQGTFTPANPGGSPFSDSFVFRRDGTYSEAAVFDQGELTTAGTITVDPSARTMTWYIIDSSEPSMEGYTNVVAYTFSTNHKILTVCQAEGEGAGTATYTKQ